MGNINSACAGCFGTENKTNIQKCQIHRVLPRKIETANNLDCGTNDHILTPSFIHDPEEKHKIFSNSSSTRASPTREHSDGRQNEPKKPSLRDFEIIKTIGKGAFGEVFLVKKKFQKKFYALKKISKANITTDNGFIERVITEKTILKDALHPFLVRLHYAFQSDKSIYLVMDYCPGGELLGHLKRKGKFSENVARFYAAELVLALEYLHEGLDIIYRDLKPENILLDANGHIKVTDFGLSKAGKRGRTFCGTPSYLAPEIIIGKTDREYDKSVDWWSLGCLIYEMLAGYLPFKSKDRNQLYKSIIENKPTIPVHFSDDARDLILKLLVTDPKNRLGFNGANEIKNHPFFDTIDWEDMLLLKNEPPIAPYVAKVRNKVVSFAEETPINNPQNRIPNFTFVSKMALETDY